MDLFLRRLQTSQPRTVTVTKPGSRPRPKDGGYPCIGRLLSGRAIVRRVVGTRPTARDRCQTPARGDGLQQKVPEPRWAHSVKIRREARIGEGLRPAVSPLGPL